MTPRMQRNLEGGIGEKLFPMGEWSELPADFPKAVMNSILSAIIQSREGLDFSSDIPTNETEESHRGKFRRGMFCYRKLLPKKN